MSEVDTMAAPDDPSPLEGYRRVNRCPECGAFVSREYGRVGRIRIECGNCGYTDVHESDAVNVTA